MIFKSKAHQQAFNKDGFFVIRDFLNPEALAKITDFYQGMNVEAVDGIRSFGIYTNSAGSSDDLNRNADAVIVEACRSSLDKHFINYSIGGGIFLLKGSGNKDVMMHQDWNMVDESRYISFAVWCPAVDVDETNGCLQMLPTSHQWFKNIRSSNMETLFITVNELKNQVIPVPLKKGDAVVFAHNIFHGSKPNRQSQTRPAVCLSLFPNSAQQVHFYRDEDEVKMIDANGNFFISQLDSLKQKDYSKVKVVGSIPYRNEHRLTRDQFDNILSKSRFRILGAKIRNFFN